MSRLNDSGALAMGAVAAAMFSVGVSLAAVACGSQPSDSTKTESRTVMTVPIASAVVAVPTPSPTPASGASTVLTSNAAVLPAAMAAKTIARRASGSAIGSTASNTNGGIVVKRFVVAAGVRDREPVLSEGSLPADGAPIYAFAELSNGTGEESHVRITFERKGSSDRVGNVTLGIPANTARYRTWGNTRFVREVGTWEAVLWSESGAELGRTSFEVTEG